MERVFVKKYAEFLMAYSDGKTIQCAIGDTGDWYDIKIENIFDYLYPQLRIKPEIKRIALTQQDLIDRINEGKTMWVKYEQFDIKYWQIAGFDLYSVFFAFDEIDYDLLSVFGTFLDGTPCYKGVSYE